MAVLFSKTANLSMCLQPFQEKRLLQPEIEDLGCAPASLSAALAAYAISWLVWLELAQLCFGVQAQRGLPTPRAQSPIWEEQVYRK
jgi:hypothetical protein